MLRIGKKFSKPTMSRVINGDIILETSTDSPATLRLDQLLQIHYPDLSRSLLQSYIKQGFVSIDQKVLVLPSTKVLATAHPHLTIPSPTPVTLPTLDILYEDQFILVVNKDDQMLSIAKIGERREPSLEDYGMPVHRLDRRTSGVIVLAKDAATRAHLQKQFANRTVKKTYLAIIHGHLKHPQAKIDLPIARSTKRPATFVVAPEGRSAVTYYQVLDINDHYSLVELHPETGRTHQLRVHLSYLGCPIVGDDLYGAQSAAHTRLMLHATTLRLNIPDPQQAAGVVREFSAPVPETLVQFCRTQGLRLPNVV